MSAEEICVVGFPYGIGQSIAKGGSGVPDYGIGQSIANGGSGVPDYGIGQSIAKGGSGVTECSLTIPLDLHLVGPRSNKGRPFVERP